MCGCPNLTKRALFFVSVVAEKEAEKGVARKDVEMTESVDKPSSNNDADLQKFARDGDKASSKKKGRIVVEEEAAEEELEEASSDGSEFWVPPTGSRWDFDNGSNDRWSDAPSHSGSECVKGVKINGHTNPAAVEDGSSFDNGDTEMCDGEISLASP